MSAWQLRGEIEKQGSIIIRNKTIPETIVRILANRGIDSPQKIEQFFAPSLNDLHNPFLLNDMKTAIERIIKAIQNKECILIHGDYDTDGITGAALLIRNLQQFGLKVVYHLPNRMTEGYGLSRHGIKKAIQEECSLIIAVDCGISAVEQIAYARQNNIDVIICDHHKPKGNLPPANAIINPRLSENYPFKELAGVGVAYKLLIGLYQTLKRPLASLYKDLDFVALGTVVDVVPLIDENRIMVKYGLEVMSKSQKPGFRALLQEAGLTKNILTSYHLGFIIGPRINACGRLYNAENALKLFLTDDPLEALKIARRLSEDNLTRQNIEKSIYEQAKAMIDHLEPETRVIVLSQADWHEGVVGIVASKLSEEYYLPTIILSVKETTAKGSARSIPGFDITEAISACQDLLIKYGGHTQAAGIELKRENIAEFTRRINHYAQGIDKKIFQRTKLYDMKLDLEEINDDLVFFLKYFEPTGLGNPQPLFFGENFEVVGIPRIVGQNHLKFAVRKNNHTFPALAYDRAEEILKIEVGKTKINCLYTINEDSYTGKTKITLKIKEMQGISE